jgi:hypothetical protein
MWVVMAAAGQQWYGGQPPLGPGDHRRHLFRPYTAVELNTLAGNYCENLLDKRLNITSYSHQGSDSNRWDAWNLQFPDDAARNLEGYVWEDRYSGMARLETVRRITKGLLAAHIPGTRAHHFFRHRSGGKTYLLFDDSETGGLLYSTWGDTIEGYLGIGFSVFDGEAWHETEAYDHHDLAEGMADPGTARSPRNWNRSPHRIEREYRRGTSVVRLAGEYGLSDEDLPVSVAFTAPSAEKLAVCIGRKGKHMPLLWDAKAPGILRYPDRQTSRRSDVDGDVTIENPGFNYVVLQKESTWACPGYSSALLILWEGRAEALEAMAENGYGEIRVVFAAGEAGTTATTGRVMLYPFPWVSGEEMEHVFRNAESFLATGRLMQNGFPSQQLMNAIPAGLAAGATLLAKYRDPFAPTARVEAENAVDAVLDPFDKGWSFARSFFPVKAAAWMVELGKISNDADLVRKYTPRVRQTMEIMLSPESHYDGRGWPDGWTHFNCMKAAWLAYEATGIETYREVYERAMEVYTIDEKGIYRDGKALDAPGGFEVYAGALPMAVWGHWGLKDNVEKLINLQVPNGWHHPEIPVADLWNDAGAGPWSQDDANPDMLGFMLRGYELPTEPKVLLPTGAFPVMHEDGRVEATWRPVVDNPFFMSSSREVVVLEGGATPGPVTETVYPIDVDRERIATEPLSWSFEVGEVRGAALDLSVSQGHYRVSVSPDGEHWIPRLDSWCDSPMRRSLDLSFLTGGTDELVRALTLYPADEGGWLVEEDHSAAGESGVRTVATDGHCIYRTGVPSMVQCHIEALVANDYRVDFSPDREHWHEALSPDQVTPAAGDDQTDAAWLRMADASNHIGPGGVVYVRLRNGGDEASYGGRPAFLARLTVYATYRTDTIHVRMEPAPFAAEPRFVLDSGRLRTW